MIRVQIEELFVTVGAFHGEDLERVGMPNFIGLTLKSTYKYEDFPCSTWNDVGNLVRSCSCIQEVR